MHSFIREYWQQYFPKLPAYQTFAARLNQLEPTLQALGAQLQARLNARQVAAFDQLLDSMLIALARSGHAYTAKVARATAAVGYCASKKLFFHGVKLHALAARRSGQLPQPQELWLREASCNNLRSFKEQERDVPLATRLGDKAYCDRALTAELAEQGILLRTRQKQLKDSELKAWAKHYNRCVSRLQQPIEGFFNWL